MFTLLDMPIIVFKYAPVLDTIVSLINSFRVVNDKNKVFFNVGFY